MRGVLRAILLLGLIMLPVMLLGGEVVGGVEVKGKVVGVSVWEGGDCSSVLQWGDEGSGGWHSEPYDGRPLMEAWPWDGIISRVLSCFNPILRTEDIFGEKEGESKGKNIKR